MEIFHRLKLFITVESKVVAGNISGKQICQCGHSLEIRFQITAYLDLEPAQPVLLNAVFQCLGQSVVGTILISDIRFSQGIGKTNRMTSEQGG
jgi:hypothetical protein